MLPDHLLQTLTELARIYAGVPMLGQTLKETVEWMKTSSPCTKTSETTSDTSGY